PTRCACGSSWRRAATRARWRRAWTGSRSRSCADGPRGVGPRGPRYNARMEGTATNFGNHLLVALPSLQDGGFAQSVVLLCQHDGDGAMGVVVNRPSEYTLGEVLEQMGIEGGDAALQAQPVMA